MKVYVYCYAKGSSDNGHVIICVSASNSRIARHRALKVKGDDPGELEFLESTEVEEGAIVYTC